MLFDRHSSNAASAPRRDRRFAVNLSASLASEGRMVPVHLLDLSVGGAMAEAGVPLAAGSRVTLRRERMEIEAMLVWRRGGRIGLLFDKPMKATELFYHLGRSREAARGTGAPAARAVAAATSA